MTTKRWPGIEGWRVAAFLAVVVALGCALMSPLDTLANDLSRVHVLQHMVLKVVAAPLIVVGSPRLVITWALRLRWRRTVWRCLLDRKSAAGSWAIVLLWNTLWIWILHATVLWIWQLPMLCQPALREPLVHDFERLTCFLVACLFRRVAIDARTILKLNPGLSILYLFTTSLQATVLGVVAMVLQSNWLHQMERSKVGQ